MIKKVTMSCILLIVLSTILVYLVTMGTALADDSDLVFYFPFEVFDGDTALNQSGNGLNGEINGDIALVDTGKRGRAAEFQKGSFIDLDGPNMPQEHIPIDEFTLCVWVKCEDTGEDHAIFNARAGDSSWLIHPDIRGDGQYRFCLRGDGDVTICDIKVGDVAWDEWVHYAGTYSRESGKATLYINGEVLQETNALADIGIASDWGMGARIGYNIDEVRPFTGLMDDFCLWKRALTKEEINLVMADGPIEAAVSPVGNMTTAWGKLKAF